ncbi:MAG: hypothetical protein ACR2QE_08030 [Acidimicrobiales bacterium]
MDRNSIPVRPDRRLLAVTALVALALVISVTYATFSSATSALSASVSNFCSSQTVGVVVQNGGSSPATVNVVINGTTSALSVAPGSTQRALVAAVEGQTYTMSATVVGGEVLLNTTFVRDCEPDSSDDGGGDDGYADDSSDDGPVDDGSTDDSSDDSTDDSSDGDDVSTDDGNQTDDSSDDGSDDETTTTTTPTTTVPTTTTPTTTVPTTTVPTSDDGNGEDDTPTTTTPEPTDDGTPTDGDDTHMNNGRPELPNTGPGMLYVQILSGLLVLCVGMVFADMGRKRSWL